MMSFRSFSPLLGRFRAVDATKTSNDDSHSWAVVPERSKLRSAAWLALILGVAPLTSLAASHITGLTCSQNSFTGAGSDTCKVSMTKVDSIRNVALTSSSSAVQVPPIMGVWSDDASDPFTATISAVTSPQTVTLTATYKGVSETFTLHLSPSSPTPAAPTLSGLACSSTSLSGAATDACTVSLSGAATSATAVTLASSSSAITVPASVTIASGASSAGFTASATVVSSAQTVTLTATSGGVSKSVALTLNPLTPGLTLSGTSAAFGTVALNTTSAKAVTLTSSGNSVLTIGSVVITGAGFADSGIGVPLTLNTGQTATLTISFDPTTAGAVSGTVTISSNAGTATISLTGTGQAASTPTLSGFSCNSSTLSGAGTDACSVGLSGPATSATTVVLASSSSALTVPASVTIASGASSAGFTATAASVTAAQTVTLTATSGSVSKTLSITLNAATPTLTLSAASVAFGNVDLNTPATQSVSMTSSGTAPVTVTAASLTGTGFSASGVSFPVTLNPGQTSTLTLQFDPTAAGAATGSVALAGNCSMGAMTISLSGTGVANATYQVELSWDAPASSSDPVAGYHIYRATGTGSYLLLNSSVSTPTSWTDSKVQAGSTYNYEVKSVDASGVESSPSNVYTAAIP